MGIAQNTSKTDEWCLQLGLQDSVKEDLFEMNSGIALDKHGKLLLRERDVSKTITDFLRAHRWCCIRLQSGGALAIRDGAYIPLNEEGTPDWICTRPSKRGAGYEVFYLETKATVGRLRPAQKAWIASMSKRGYVTCVANSFSVFLEFYEANCE